MTRTRIKICGLTREKDVQTVVSAGADAIGLVFAPKSPRKLDMWSAQQLAARIPAFIDRVGLFQDQAPEEIASILDQVPLNLLQFHGSESATFCEQFGLPYIKAISMNHSHAIRFSEKQFSSAAGLLLDSHEPGKAGGTGQVFDWSQIHDSEIPLIVAGGLKPENVFEVVTRFRPWAVDVSSGVEQSPGIKDMALVRRFVEEVQRGDR